jgi:two-component system, NarL family, sensor kinase
MLQKLFFSFGLLFSITVYSQVGNLDSVEKVIVSMPDDTTKVNKLNFWIEKLKFQNPVKAARLDSLSLKICSKINYPLGLAIALRLRGVLYADKTNIDSARMFYDKALLVVKDKKEKDYIRQLGLIYNNYGVLTHLENKYDSATNYYLKAAKMFTSIDEEALLFFPYNNLCEIYLFLQDYPKSLEYAEKANAAAIKRGDDNWILCSSNYIASNKLKLKKTSGLDTVLKQNGLLAKSISNFPAAALSYNVLGEFYADYKINYDSAIYYFKQALFNAEEKAGDKYFTGQVYHNLGRVYMLKNDYKNASINLKKAFEISKELNIKNIEQYATGSLALLEEKQGNYKQAFLYLKSYVDIKDTVNAKYNRDKTTELATKYETEKKETQLKLQESSIKQKNTLNILLGSVATAILILSLFSYKNYQNKQKLQQQKIAELETKQQLNATEAVLKGEEQERIRLAKDLHDGLGGMLSGIKYSFNNMKENLILTPDTTQAFTRSMDMLDNSIQEMRRVAHNMMPESLVRYGLDKSLQDYITEINKSGMVKVVYQSMGMENKIVENTTAITIYRIVQELLNNVTKHASAKQVLVQLLAQGNKLVVNVEDDGRGFDTAIIEKADGIGWKNIKSRVEFLKGTLEVQSAEDKGTAVNLEFNI